MLCADRLKSEGIDYVLAESDTVFSGITKNTTAKITSQHGLIYDKIIKKYGVDKARLYLDANEAAVVKYRELCKNIDCDFEDKTNFVYSKSGESKLGKELDSLDKIGYRAGYSDTLPLPFETDGAIYFENQAQFNPLKFGAGITNGLNIFEHTPIRELKGTTAVTDQGEIHAQIIIVATHFPFINKHGGYFIKMYQHRSYVIAIENAPQLNGMFVDEADKGMSFRNYKDLLLVGGGGHRTGKNGGGFQELQSFILTHYPSAKEKYLFATQDCMSLDSVPYIGKYSESTPNMYVATGFNKWGMTSSMVAANVLADMILDRKNPYSELFSPSRTVFHPKLAANAFESVIGLASFSKKRCPHLGCALKWNRQEHSWDCPCHGSRFNENGVIIDNPATGDLKQ